MGRVYRATGPYGEEVALKLLKADLARDDVVRRRFDREARIAQRIVHGHVVPVLDVGEHEGTPYLAQAFVRGGTLAEKIDRLGRLEIGEAGAMGRGGGGGVPPVPQGGGGPPRGKPPENPLHEHGNPLT